MSSADSVNALAEQMAAAGRAARFVLSERIDDASEALCRLLDRDDLRGRDVAALSPPVQADGAASERAFRDRVAAARAGLSQSFEWRLLRGDGQGLDVLISLESPDGRIVHGRVRHLGRIDGGDLLDARTPLRQIVDNAPAVIYVKDKAGRHLFVNHPFCELFGLSFGEVIGRTDADIFPARQAEQFALNDAQILETGRSIEFEETVTLADGEHVYLSQKFPLHDAGGAPFAVCGISTDITARKRSDDILRNVALGVSAARGEEVFPALLKYLAHTLGVDYAFIGLLSGDGSRIETLSLLADGEILPPMSYEIAGTPCETVLGKEFGFFPQEVARQFQDTMLAELSVQGYAGYPLADSDGRALGILSVMHRERLVDRELVHSMLQIFAVRAATEVERSFAEKARQESEASYRAIFEASESAIFVHDIETGAIVDVNPKACSAYGYTREEMLDVDIGDLSSGEPPYTADNALAHVRKAIDGEPQRLLWHRRNRDGSLHWDEVFLKRATIGGVDRVIAITHDVTELKNAQDALRISEEQYRTVFNASVDGLVLCSPDHRVADANPALGRMLGYARDELLAAHPESLVPMVDGNACAAMLEKSHDGMPFHVEGMARRRDGVEFAVEVHGVPVHYGGRPHLLAIVRDITERKEREDALRKSEDRLRATVEAAMDCVIGMNARGQVVEFNPAAETCFGYRREEVMGRQLSEIIIPPRYRAAHHAGMDRYFENGEGPFLGRRVEIEAMRADRSEFPAELAIDVAQGPDGPMFIGYLREITDRKRAENERARLEAQLRQAQKMEAIGHLSGGIAHDFNNILTSVMGYLVLAEQRQAQYKDAKLAEYLARAQRSSEKARDLIQQMLTFSRGQRGERRPLALAPVVKEAVKLLRSTFPTTIAFHTEFDAGAPPAMLDPVQFEQVLMNLCINARDAITGSGRLTIGVHGVTLADGVCTACRQSVNGRYVELLVGDNGAGISPENLDRIFEPFFTTKDVGKGSGMGLSTVHGIVHEHGGHVVVETGRGLGAVFRVLFPALDGATRAADAVATSEAGGGEPGLAGRVLIVDDEPDVAEFMRELFETWGMQATVLRSGSEALRVFVLDTEQFDLVVTDQTMPGLTGSELAAQLLRLRPQLPILLYTGYSEQVSEETSRQAGIRAVLRKPLDVPRLEQLVREVLSGPR
jgi:PAS domain S-box-containing protein